MGFLPFTLVLHIFCSVGGEKPIAQCVHIHHNEKQQVWKNSPIAARVGCCRQIALPELSFGMYGGLQLSLVLRVLSKL